jgi:molybdate transport system substrate-binding protein
MKRHAYLIALFAFVVWGGGAAAADIKVLSSNGIRSVLVEVLPQFERSSGHKVSVGYDTANLLVGRIKAGESGDLAIMTGPAMDELVKLNRVVAAGRVELARSGVGVGVRAGLPKPDSVR